MADIETLPLRKQIESAAQLGKTYTDPNTGKTYDFSGTGDKDKAIQAAQTDAETADLSAKAMLDVGNKYNAQFIDQAKKGLELSDPSRYKIGNDLGKTMENELAHLDDNDPEAMKQVEADIRGRQFAMGNTRGNAPTADEILGKYDTRQRIRQQKLGNLTQYLSNTPITAQFSSLTGAQQGASPYAPVNYNPGIGLNANAGAQGSQFAMQSYGQQSANINAANQYGLDAWKTKSTTPNPWISAAGTMAGAAATAF